MDEQALIERVTGIPYEEFARAYYLMASPEDAPELLRETARRLHASPGDDFVMGPNFLSVLALFSERGAHIAHLNMAADDIRRRQRELAQRHPEIARQFPRTLMSD